jgi:SAM-dependent methyltransferase
VRACVDFSMPDANSCWLCGGSAARVPEYSSVVLYRCTGCSFVFQPDLARDELRSHHDAEYFDDYGVRGAYDDTLQRRFEARRRVRWLRKHGVQRARVLEIGAATGFFLEEARRQGLDAVGIEPEPGAALAARRRSGAQVIDGFVEDVDIPAPMDAVCMWHVLEHVPDPVPTLRRLRQALRPGGLFFCEVPNIDCALAHAKGDRWSCLEPEHHVGHFNAESIRVALSTAGFEPVVRKTVPMVHYARWSSRRWPVEAARSIVIGRRHRIPAFRADPDRHELLRAVARAA